MQQKTAWTDLTNTTALLSAGLRKHVCLMANASPGILVAIVVSFIFDMS